MALRVTMSFRMAAMMATLGFLLVASKVQVRTKGRKATDRECDNRIPLKRQTRAPGSVACPRFLVAFR